MNTEMNNEIITTVVSPLEVCITCRTELLSVEENNFIISAEELRNKLHRSCCTNFLNRLEEAFEAKQAEELEAFKSKQKQEKIDRYIALFDRDNLSIEERVVFCSRQMQLEAQEGVKILGKKNAKIERDRARLDDTEERQRVQLARKQAERRQAFEEKNQASLKETTDIMEGEIAIWEAIKDLYEDTGPMLK